MDNNIIKRKELAGRRDAEPKQHSDDDLPAFPGARFNSAGLCKVCHTVRLCKVTNVGNYRKYRILHKNCQKCTNSALRSAQNARESISPPHLVIASPIQHNVPHVKLTSRTLHQSRSQDRFRGRISRALSGESTDSGERMTLDPPCRRRRSSSRSRKLVVRKQVPKPKIDEASSSLSKSDETIIANITTSSPPKGDYDGKHVGNKDDDVATLPTISCTSSHGSDRSVSSASSAAHLKQQIRDLSGLFLSIQMNDSADKLSAILQDDHPSRGVHSHHDSARNRCESYNSIRDDASAKYIYRKSKRVQSSLKNHGEKVVAFKEYLETIPISI